MLSWSVQHLLLQRIRPENPIGCFSWWIEPELLHCRRRQRLLFGICGDTVCLSKMSDCQWQNSTFDSSVREDCCQCDSNRNVPRRTQQQWLRKCNEWRNSSWCSDGCGVFIGRWHFWRWCSVQVLCLPEFWWNALSESWCIDWFDIVV